MKKFCQFLMLKKHLFLPGIILVAAVLIVITAIFRVTAAPPGSPYTPGETLAPTSVPGDTNCTVTAPAVSGANSDITSLTGLNSAIIDGDNAEAFLVRKNSDAGDVLNVDTSADGNITLYTNGTGKLDVDRSIDLDFSVTDPVSTTNAADIYFGITTTTPASNTNRGASYSVQYLSNDGLTSTNGGLIGFLSGLSNVGSGTVGTAWGARSVITNSGGGTITSAIGNKIELNNIGAGTVSEFTGIDLQAYNTAPVAAHAFNFGTEFISNSRAVDVESDGSAQRYMPLSTADTGITFDSTDLTLATTTSGNVNLSPAGNVVSGRPVVLTPQVNQALAAGNAITVSASVVQVSGSGGAITLTSTPEIANGADGQMVTLVGTDDANTLTVQDESSSAGSNLQLAGGTNFTLGQGDSLQLMFHSDTGDWVEISRSNN